MIARDSKSYPYLAIAQHYSVPYGEVLKYSDSQDWPNATYPPYTQWRFDVWLLERNKFNDTQN